METRRVKPGVRALTGVGLGAIAALAGSAQATWSILIADTRTGEIGLASATCLTGFNLRHNTPVLITGVGGATAQSAVDQTGQNRGVIRDMLLQGVAPADILVALSVSDIGHDNRQYGMLDVTGRTLTYSGVDNAQWAGGQTGQVGDLVYAIQGNILTGEPVVQAAVDAVRFTPGDIPARLMAAMEAAAAFGGDGRCSCSAGPTDCGSPPPSFEKSAHIAYMLIARAGDTDGCNQILDTRGLPTSLVIGDINADARVDVIATTSAATNMSVLLNVTGPGAALASLALADEFAAGAVTLRGAGGEFTGDVIADVAVCSQGSDVVIVFPIGEDGTLGAGISTGVGDGPVAIASGDLDGAQAEDLVTVNADGSVSVLLNSGAGTFNVTSISPMLGSGSSIATGDFNGDGRTDVALAHQALGAVSTLLGDGSGGFVSGTFAFVGAGPAALVRDDFNGDGLDDLATAGSDAGSVSVLLSTGASFSRTDVPAPDGRPVVRLAGGRMNGDASGDLVAVLSQPTELVSLLNDTSGAFAFGTPAPVPTGVTALGTGDLNGDGLDDAVMGASGVGGLVTAENQGGGAFLQELGCAAGDYFMTFNVPNTTQADPDPVITLRETYDAWRADLVGRPDAIRSIATGTTSLAASGGGMARGRIRAEIRDWRGIPVDLGPGALSAALAFGSDGVVEIGAIHELGGGVYEIELSAGAELGRDRIEISVNDGVRPVTLMPALSIEVLDSRVDFDGDGVAGFGDVLAFLQAFVAQDPRADLDGSTTFDATDVVLFVGLFSL